jgi:RNA polymerase sigma-70 factor (ECF subfamily)
LAFQRLTTLLCGNLPEARASGTDAEVNIFLTQVLSQVMALPEAQRITVVLVYVEGYSYQEASEVLGIPVGTVMSRLAGARGRLAQALGETRGKQHGQGVAYGTKGVSI